MSLPQIATSTLERIATLMASGLPAAKISAVVGLSPSRIAQINATEDFKLLLQEKMEEHSKKDIEEEIISAKYLSAEHILVDQLVQMAPAAEFRDVASALRIVAERQDKALTRKNPVHAGVVVHQNIVQLNLPTHALPEVVISKENEVIDVNGKNMAPLTSQGVESLFAQMKENRNVQGRVLESSSRVVAEAPQQAGYAEQTNQATQLSLAL